MEINTERGQPFFVQTLSGHEQKAQESIQNRIETEDMADSVFDVVVPMERVTEIRRGEKKTTERKFFPGYLLIIVKLYRDNGEIDERVWHFIKDTPGVTGFIGGRPQPLSDSELRDICEMMREDAETERPKIDFELGEMVKIKDGPFENFDGKIEAIDTDHGKLNLSVSIFGRSTPVEVDYWQVERED
mgnify:FL=1